MLFTLNPEICTGPPRQKRQPKNDYNTSARPALPAHISGKVLAYLRLPNLGMGID